MSAPSSYRWAVLFVCFLSFVAFAFVFQLMPPLSAFVQSDFGISDAEFGLLMTIVMVPGIFLALPIGLLVNRYGFRLLGFASTVLAAVGSLITALSTTYVVALVGRVVLGTGAAFIIVGTPTFIPQWFSHKDLGKAMGLYSTNMPLATILAFPVGSILAERFDWHYPFYLGAVLGVAAAVVFFLLVKEGPLKDESAQVGWKDVKQATKNSEVWKASVVWMLFNAAAIGFLSWAPRLFSTFKGLPQLYADVLATVLMYAALVFVPIFGLASDRVGRRKPFMIAGAIILAIALNVASYTTGFSLILTVVVLGIAAAMVPPLVMAITADSLPPNLAGTGFSIVTLCQNIGIALSAPIGGYFLQTTGAIGTTLFGISLFSVGATIAAAFLRSK